jgi:hypothetical protein
MNADRKVLCMAAFAAAIVAMLGTTRLQADPPNPAKADPPKTAAKTAEKNAADKKKELRVIRVAVFNIESQGIDIQPAMFRGPNPRPRIFRDGGDADDERERQEYNRRQIELQSHDPSGEGALTDQINVLLSMIDRMTIVNRDQLKKVADEHQIALSGLGDTANAVKLGKFLSAQYIVVGRASKIGQTYYLVLKIVDVETTEQTTVSAKSPVENGFANVLERLNEPLTASIQKLQQPVIEPADAALAELRRLAKPLLGKAVLVSVEETHVNRPLVDPAAQMAIMQRLRSLGVTVIVPKEPVDGWKETLLETGRYGKQKVDFLLEGEGTSAYAAQLQGLMSCRARVELRLIATPGREITTSDRGVASGVDLVESLAAKAALEEAGRQACDAVVRRLAEETKK